MTTSSHDRSSQTSAFSSKLPARAYPQDDQSQRSFACHGAHSQNATHAFGEHRPLIKQPASCTVISDQLGPSLSCGCNATSICFVQPATTSETHVHTHGIFHRDCCTVPTFSNTSAPRTAKRTPPLHQSSQQWTYYGLESAILRRHPKSRLLQTSIQHGPTRATFSVWTLLIAN